MELLLVFLSTAIGTVVGVLAAVFMMQRKTRSNPTGSDSILRTQLQNTEWALAAAGRDVEELRKQLEERQAEALATRAQLEGAQQKLAAAAAEAETEAARLAQYDELAAKSLAEKDALAARVSELEANAPSAEEAQQQAAGLARQIEEEKERACALAADLDGVRQALLESDNRRNAVEAELVEARAKYESLMVQCMAEREHATELTRQLAADTDRIAGLSAELGRLRDGVAQAEQDSDMLHRQLAAEQERTAALSAELDTARTAHTSLETMLQKERESAAQGMKLLLQVQNMLAGTTPVAPAVAPASGNGYANGTAA